MDCHFHIYDSSRPATPGATLNHPDASVADYRRLQQRIGARRGVIVQPSTYGTDNRLHLEGLRALGSDDFRMVAVLDPSVSDAELATLHDAGVRGVRFNLSFPGGLGIEALTAFGPRLAELGWNCQLNLRPRQVAEHADTFLRLPGALVFDHMAHLREFEGADRASFDVLRRLLDAGRTWVKLSGAYVFSRSGPPGYEDAGKLASAIASAAPERIVWGSDWPHPTKSAKSKPDDAALLDRLTSWLPSRAVRQRMLVDNPTELYGFASAPARPADRPANRPD